MSRLSPENEFFAKKVQNNCKKVLKNLHMSKKSSTFAAAFVKNPSRDSEVFSENRENLRQQIIEVSEANPRSSAVGSALRSGRRGRVFESPLLDKRVINRWLFLLSYRSPYIIYYCARNGQLCH